MLSASGSAVHKPKGQASGGINTLSFAVARNSGPGPSPTMHSRQEPKLAFTHGYLDSFLGKSQSTATKKAKREKSTKASIKNSHRGGSDDNEQTFERFQMPNILSPVQKQSKKEKEQAALRRAVAPTVEDPKLQLKE